MSRRSSALTGAASSSRLKWKKLVQPDGSMADVEVSAGPKEMACRSTRQC